uniref:DUF6602 domain-containing protein n=1 Tax=Candidatus Methanophagaceae archaeon ANME-1 ERB6 TaxID=2759912 RepID=A0A7G9YX10_9EURY|nr:hypothetical protein BJKGENCM_00034 [Methanosarcinales archaeon ANME-1 ERB6]
MKFKMKELFDSISKRMMLDFEEISKTLTHPGLKGTSKEEKFREFLRKYFPMNLDMSKGQIIDSDGHISKEIDVIVSDAFKTPIFGSVLINSWYYLEHQQFLPCPNVIRDTFSYAWCSHDVFLTFLRFDCQC